MKQIETEILIDVKPETVWKVLTDFESYPLWNPFIRSIQGEKAVGKFLKVLIQPPGGKGMTFKPAILKFVPAKEFRWKGSLGIKGIFDGEHYFILQETEDHQTRFIHGEKFRGILVPLMAGGLAKTEKGFHLMNEAIKKESENLK
jgi:hypothetical protein